MKKGLFILGFCMFSFLGFAQLEINAELRPRGEVRHGYKLLPAEDSDPATFVSQRTRLNMYYSHTKFKIGFAIQDVRIWGDEQLFNATGVYGDNASLDLNEGWLEMIAGQSHALRMGRQYWVYEDERLLSRRNWNQHSIKYDGLLYKFEPKDIKLHLGLSLNNTADNVIGNDYTLYREVTVFDSISQSLITVKVPLESRIKTQNFLYISKNINDKLSLSFQALATGFHKQESANTIYLKGTYGMYVLYKPGKFTIKANGFYQHGKNIKGNKVSAYLANVKSEVKLDKVKINAGIDYHSGHDQTNQNTDYQATDHLFDLFYGVRHRFYGYMDLFDNLSRSTKNGGLVDIYTGLGLNVLKNTILSLDYHYFSLQNKVLDPYATDQTLKKPLGSEIDLTVEVSVIPEIGISGGFSTMLPTISMEKLQGYENGENGFAYWGWVMITAKPTLFKSEK